MIEISQYVHCRPNYQQNYKHLQTAPSAFYMLYTHYIDTDNVCLCLFYSICTLLLIWVKPKSKWVLKNSEDTEKKEFIYAIVL